MIKKYRKPTKIEQSIIERCLTHTLYIYTEIFIFFTILGITIWWLVFLSFTENWFLGLITLALAIVISLFLLVVWDVIKETKTSCSHLVYSEKGEWKIEIQGDSAKTQHFVSKVNDKKIVMPVPKMYTPPEYGDPKNIEYEYIQILESPPPFGSNFLFMSIEGNNLEKKHLDYLNHIRYVGLFSIVLNVCFIVSLIFYFYSGLKMIMFPLYISIFLFLHFIISIFIWSNNRELKKEL